MHDHAFYTSLSATLRERRATLRLNQVDVAELAGCSTRFVHAAEAGKTTLRLDKLIAVLDALGLDLAVQLASGGDRGSTGHHVGLSAKSTAESKGESSS